MDERPDGRKYARVTRRSRLLLESIPSGSGIAVSELTDAVVKRSPDEFFLERYERAVSPERLRVYVRYLQHLDAVQIEERKVERTMTPLPRSDAQWAQQLADLARGALSELVGTTPANLPTKVADVAQALLASGSPPTIPELVRELGALAGQDEEYARWDVYLMCDAPASKFEIRRYPTLWLS
jgi:hypothetical protein